MRINSAFEHLQAAGPPQAAWDNIAPGAEEAEEPCTSRRDIR